MYVCSYVCQPPLESACILVCFFAEPNGAGADVFPTTSVDVSFGHGFYGLECTFALTQDIKHHKFLTHIRTQHNIKMEISTNQVGELTKRLQIGIQATYNYSSKGGRVVGYIMADIGHQPSKPTKSL